MTITRPGVIPVAEVAEILDVCTRTVRRRCDAGVLDRGCPTVSHHRHHATVTAESLALYLAKYGTHPQWVRARERLGSEFGDWV